MKLKNISEQTIVITGATSGIGLTTARMAAEKGAKLVLVARNEDALRELTDEIKSNGGQAIYVAADVADQNALQAAADKAKQEFGGFDTWVNDAGGSIYGRIADVPTEDLRRLFETNVWGVVNGSKIAVEHLKNKGGALINLGSEVSIASIPLQGMYSASKHAVKGFTDALRMEIEGDELPISVTLIKPTAIHTPFPENAKNYLPYKPQLPPPVYAPELVAEAILYSAETPTREFFVGGMAKAHASMARNTPRLYEIMNEKMIDSMQNSGEPAQANGKDGLYETNSKLHQRGEANRFVIEHSVYQEAKLHPFITSALAIGGGIALAAFLGSRKTKSGENSGDRKSQTRGFDGKIREHTEVVGSDGHHVGTVDHVEGDMIRLRKNDANAAGMHHEIPLSWVETVETDVVRLNKPAREAVAEWQIDTEDLAEFQNSLKSAGA